MPTAPAGWELLAHMRRVMCARPDVAYAAGTVPVQSGIEGIVALEANWRYRMLSLMSAARRPNILVVDDEPIVVEVVGRYLRREGFSVTTAANGDEAFAAATDVENPPSAIVLDVMLPGMDGLELCRNLRNERKITTPVILLTARGEEADRISGLGIGADDYVVKPFSPGELVARVKAQLRRVQLDTALPVDGHLRGGDLDLDPVARTLLVRGVSISLTAKEFDLLEYLMRHRGEPFSRDDLLDAVWDPAYVGGPATVTVHIRRLREKVERDPGRPTHLKAIWGTGYKFDPTPAN